MSATRSWRERLGPPNVVVFTRRGCGLCRTAEDLATAEAPAGSVTLVDVDGDADLQRRYHIRVPVVQVDGREVAEGQVSPGQIRAAVRAARLRRFRGTAGSH